MANWLKITKPNIEMSSGFLIYQSAIINMDAAACFAVQNAGSVTFFIEGKAYVIQQQFDGKAYDTAMKYVQARTQGISLP